MATSYVEYKGYGYWAHDSYLEGLLYLLVREFKHIKPQSDWLNSLIEEWTFAYSAGF
jgi:hypothetical protein